MSRRVVSCAVPTLAVASAAFLGACATPADEPQTVGIYAASSLTEAFAELERLFERAHPDADVQLTFAGSQVLRLQIEQGAPADVFASANPAHMETLIEAGLVPEAWTFAHNELVVIVPLDNPANVESFADLPRAERIVVGTDNVPVGRYTREALNRAGPTLGHDFRARVMERVVSEETNVRLTRAKVELGEADAAVVYRTDAVASDRVRVLDVPPEVNVRADYLIGAVTWEAGDAPSTLAEAWIALIRSAEGQAVLARHGFAIE
jgi:molybdate transport system substrate-binding protein